MTIIVLVVLAVIVMWIISVQRQLVSKDELCKNAMSQIGVQQNSRWDALTALVDLVKGYSEHEYKTLMDVIGMRARVTGSSTAAEAQAQENLINNAMKSINVVVEQYPNLKANEMFTKTMDSVNTYENQVRLSRMTYNDTATKYNELVRMFPGSLVAGMFGFAQRDYLAEPVGKTDMPSMKF